MISFLCNLFRILRAGDKFILKAGWLDNTQITATIKSVKNDVVVYEVVMNNSEKAIRINSVKRFKQIYRQRL